MIQSRQMLIWLFAARISSSSSVLQAAEAPPRCFPSLCAFHVQFNGPQTLAIDRFGRTAGDVAPRPRACTCCPQSVLRSVLQWLCLQQAQRETMLTSVAKHITDEFLSQTLCEFASDVVNVRLLRAGWLGHGLIAMVLPALHREHAPRVHGITRRSHTSRSVLRRRRCYGHLDPPRTASDRHTGPSRWYSSCLHRKQ